MFFLLVVVVCAFTHTFVVLLQRVNPSEFVRSFEGSVNGWPLTMTTAPEMNRFQDVGWALKTVWFFLHGNYDAIEDRPVEHRALVIILAILFPFFTGIVLLNVIMQVKNPELGKQYVKQLIQSIDDGRCGRCQT